MSLRKPPIKNSTENQIVLSEEFISSKKSLFHFVTHINHDFVLWKDDKIIDTFSGSYKNTEEVGIPRIIQKRFWLQLYTKTNTYLINQCLTSEREWKWVTTNFKVRRNEDNEILNYLIERNIPSKRTIENIKSLYKKLIDIEKTMGIEVANNYFNKFLAEKSKTYDQYMKELCLSTDRTMLKVNYHKNNAIPSIS
ncbi:hypothetical protein [Aquimarina litoralis]